MVTSRPWTPLVQRPLSSSSRSLFPFMWLRILGLIVFQYLGREPDQDPSLSLVLILMFWKHWAHYTGPPLPVLIMFLFSLTHLHIPLPALTLLRQFFLLPMLTVAWPYSSPFPKNTGWDMQLANRYTTTGQHLHVLFHQCWKARSMGHGILASEWARKGIWAGGREGTWLGGLVVDRRGLHQNLLKVCCHFPFASLYLQIS